MRQALARRNRPRPTGQGACPNCGDLVPRFHQCSDGNAAEILACSNCGRFAYTTEGPELPLVVPVR